MDEWSDKRKSRRKCLEHLVHIMRRENSEAVKTFMEMNVEGRGRPKKR